MDYVMVERSFPLEKVSCVPADLLEEMLAVIRTSLPAETEVSELMFKSKYVLTELITNALKHAESNNTHLRLQLYDNKVRFVKTDNGNKLSIPVVYDEFKGGYIVTNDIMHTLYAVDKDGRMYFYFEEHNEPVFGMASELPEHFGLLIITKASDEFYYTHNNNDRLNTFSVTINF